MKNNKKYTMRKRETKLIDGVLYYEDRPSSCRLCYYWKNRKAGCILGRENCCYLASPPKKEKSPCDGCCYAPCVGFCMNKILGKGDVPAYA